VSTPSLLPVRSSTVFFSSIMFISTDEYRPSSSSSVVGLLICFFSMTLSSFRFEALNGLL
jgi:hypothetical protein